jgi:predicted Zn-dependent protease
MLLEAWPEDLRARLLALGSDFAEAVLRLEEGDARGAWEALGPFAAAEPAVRLPRGRAALALGMHARAASELCAFAEAFGHRRIGGAHTAVLLARALTADRRPEEALDVLRTQRVADTDLELAAHEVAVLEALGRLPEADRAGVELLRRAPGDLGVYRLLARIRMKGGERVAAMQVLESGLTRLCRGPGKCGSQPFDVDAARMLAQLYLEDRLEPGRADELLHQIALQVREPAWIDGYLAALRARNRDEPGTAARVRVLARDLPEDDPRLGLLRQHLSTAP